MAESVETLERGDIYMAFRPTVDTDAPEGLGDVQRLYVILSQRDADRYRLMVIGRKRLPDPAHKGREREWGFVEAVARKPEDIEDALDPVRYQTKTRGERTRPAARPVGEGVYRIVRHGDHTHLVYALELPEAPGEVQDTLNIEPEASYIISVKNPEAPSPRGVGLRASRKASFPKSLQRRFRGRRFCELDPPSFLDHEGAEIVLVAASSDVGEELGIELETEHESAASADIFGDLRMERDQHPLEPLFQGVWK